jgi:hypothetical protein
VRLSEGNILSKKEIPKIGMLGHHPIFGMVKTLLKLIDENSISYRLRHNSIKHLAFEAAGTVILWQNIDIRNI